MEYSNYCEADSMLPAYFPSLPYDLSDKCIIFAPIAYDNP